MDENLSINKLELSYNNLSHNLSSEWNDKVGMSYQTYIKEEKRLIEDIEYVVKKVNEKFRSVNSTDVEKFKRNYENNRKRLEQLSRGN